MPNDRIVTKGGCSRGQSDAPHCIMGGQSWSQTAVVTREGAGHWAGLGDF